MGDTVCRAPAYEVIRWSHRGGTRVVVDRGAGPTTGRRRAAKLLAMTQRHLLQTLTTLLGAVWAATGAIRFAGGHAVEGIAVDTPLAHVLLGGFSLALLLTVPAMLGLAAYARGRSGVWIAAPGLIAFAVAATASNVGGDDPSWFWLVAGPANALWLAGSIVLAVSLSRAGRVPRSVAIGLPLVQVAALPLSMLGGLVAAGGYWLAVGWLDRGGALASEAPAAG
jgi:hypothetical protein